MLAERSPIPRAHRVISLLLVFQELVGRLSWEVRTRATSFQQVGQQRARGAYLIWPRISPAGEAVLCTFAYARPCRMAGSTADSSPADTPRVVWGRTSGGGPGARPGAPVFRGGGGGGNPGGGGPHADRKITMPPGTFDWAT